MYYYYSYQLSKVIYFYSKMKNAILFAFFTASSAATIPITLKTVEEELKVEKSVASFSVPLGATINMDGTVIVQGGNYIYSQCLWKFRNLRPYFCNNGSHYFYRNCRSTRVGLIMLAMVLNQVGLPSEGIALIIGIDRLLDMTRKVNVTGDAAISCVVVAVVKKINYN